MMGHEARTTTAISPRMAQYVLRFLGIYTLLLLVLVGIDMFLHFRSIALWLLVLMLPAWRVAGRFKDVEDRAPTALEATLFTLAAFALSSAIAAAVSSARLWFRGEDLLAQWAFFSAKFVMVDGPRPFFISWAVTLGGCLLQMAVIWLLFRYVEGRSSPTGRMGAPGRDRNFDDVSF
jgi:hypothetical protein